MATKTIKVKVPEKVYDLIERIAEEKKIKKAVVTKKLIIIGLDMIYGIKKQLDEESKKEGQGD